MQTTNKQIYELIIKLTVTIAELNKQQKKQTSTRLKVFYSYAEVSRLLCVSVAAIQTKVKRGTLKRVCSDSTPLISRIELIKYLQGQNPNTNFDYI